MTKSLEEKKNGYEIAPINPGWIKPNIPDKFADDDLKELFIFYVINTPCVTLSSKGKDLTTYGWDNNIWRRDALKNYLFGIANIKHDSTFVVAKNTYEMKDACEIASLKKDFNRNREHERIAIYKGDYSEFLGICYHIRNSFAHGRFEIYENSEDKDNPIFVMEDGVKRNGKYQVRARMILKKSTLVKWMEILQSGKYPEDINIKLTKGSNQKNSKTKAIKKR